MDDDSESDSSEDYEEIVASPMKHIRQNQIRMAMCAIANGENAIIPPKWNPILNGVCEASKKLPRTTKPESIHRWSMEKLRKLHQKHLGTQGPNTYNEMYKKLRQHFCFYAGWAYYDVPEKRIRAGDKRQRK